MFILTFNLIKNMLHKHKLMINLILILIYNT